MVFRSVWLLRKKIVYFNKSHKRILTNERKTTTISLCTKTQQAQKSTKFDLSATETNTDVCRFVSRYSQIIITSVLCLGLFGDGLNSKFSQRQYHLIKSINGLEEWSFSREKKNLREMFIITHSSGKSSPSFYKNNGKEDISFTVFSSDWYPTKEECFRIKLQNVSLIT